MRVLLDQFGDVIRYMHMDHTTEAEGRVVIETISDPSAVIEANKAIRNSGIPQTRDKSMRLAARIPAVVQAIWEAEDGVRIDRMPAQEKMAYIARRLKDSDYRDCLTVPTL